MVHKIACFNKSVNSYKKEIKTHNPKNKLFVIELKLGDWHGFYSLAPLSRALHDLGADVSVFVTKEKSKGLISAEKCWTLFEEIKNKNNSKKKGIKELKEFINAVNKKTKSKDFEKLFKRPEVVLKGNSKKNVFEGTEIKLEYRDRWLRKRKWKALVETANQIWKQGYALKKTERCSLGFELVPASKDMELPLEDYLDNFVIANAMAETAQRKCKTVSVGSSTNKKRQTDPMNRVDDLITSLSGCEQSKESKEGVFKKFKKLSKYVYSSQLKSSDAGFGIHGTGYGGKHFFGTTIGYPSPNGKTRWQSPGTMFLKPSWLDQTRIDDRMPKTRYAITETLPIENFVRTCNIDYVEMRARNEAIKKVVEKSKYLFVKGKQVKGGQTDLKIDLRKILYVLKSDSDVRHKLNPNMKSQGIKAGMYGNFPGGEAFLTPGPIQGTVIGDVVISISGSHTIPESNPLVVEFNGMKYKIKSGPKEIIKKMNQKKNDSKKLIKEYEKHKSIPKKIIDSYKRNFEGVGEFAINTNPKAKLGRYLIENEKIAKMIHIALGSGYEPGRETLYHWDFVINSPRQELDIYGIDEKGKEQWVIKKGRFVA